MNEKPMINLYNKEEIKDLITNHKDELVYVDTGIDEIVIKYEDIPDVIVDINDKFGSTNLKIARYDFDKYPSFEPIVTTIGYYLDKCNLDVRNDIIDRLVKLQHEEEKVKDYKVINEDMLDEVRNSLMQEEMER